MSGFIASADAAAAAAVTAAADAGAVKAVVLLRVLLRVLSWRIGACRVRQVQTTVQITCSTNVIKQSGSTLKVWVDNNVGCNTISVVMLSGSLDNDDTLQDSDRPTLSSPEALAISWCLPQATNLASYPEHVNFEDFVELKIPVH